MRASESVWLKFSTIGRGVKRGDQISNGGILQPSLLMPFDGADNPVLEFLVLWRSPCQAFGDVLSKIVSLQLTKLIQAFIADQANGQDRICAHPRVMPLAKDAVKIPNGHTDTRTQHGSPLMFVKADTSSFSRNGFNSTTVLIFAPIACISFIKRTGQFYKELHPDCSSPKSNHENKRGLLACNRSQVNSCQNQCAAKQG